MTDRACYNVSELNPVYLFFPARANFNSSLLELTHMKPNTHLALALSLILNLSLTLKPTASLTLTLPLTLKHYPLKKTTDTD